MIKVLLVDDSAVELEFLDYILKSDKDIEIIGKVKDGQEAVNFLTKRKPDVITMDIHMPGMDGYEATKIIMATNPVPIVIVSASSGQDVDKTYKALNAGALAFVLKPVGFENKDFEKVKNNLIQTVKLMSEVKVVKRRTFTDLENQKSEEKLNNLNILEKKSYSVVVIGASTGGPAALHNLFSHLKGNFSLPIIVVQHIASGFLNGLLEWLSDSTKLNYKLPGHNETIKPGTVYFAPDDYHIGISKNMKIILSKDDYENGLKPAVSYLFRSAAYSLGDSVIGIIMTGMGKDGAAELKLIRENGGLTIAQDKESSVVFGMPYEAIKLDAPNYVLSPERIASLLSLIENDKFKG